MSDYSKYTDSQLIALLGIDGKEKDLAFREILERYGWRIFAYCRHKTDSRKDAKDLNQEIWLRFYFSVLKGKSDICLPQYLFGIGSKIAAEFQACNGKVIKVNEDVFDINSIIAPISLEDSIEKKDLINIIKLCADNLNEQHKETFILKWISGLTVSEISEITGETVECIKQRSHRSMDEILKLLKPIIEELKK